MQNKTINDYHHFLKLIEEILQKLGGQLLVKFEYSDILYPKDIVSILALSRHEKYAFDPDWFLEFHLGLWLTKHVKDVDLYLSQLIAAIKERGCSEGVILRLNHLIVVPYNSIGLSKEECLTSNNMRKRIKAFLIDNESFTKDLNKIYFGLRNIHMKYDLEQSILSWMCYLIIKSIAASKDIHIKYSPKQLILHE